MTKLKAINIFFFQWFFIRLTKCSEKRIENYTIQSYDFMHDGTISPRGIGETKIYYWYAFQFWILPCSGWKNDFIYLNKNKKPGFLKCTTPKYIK